MDLKELLSEELYNQVMAKLGDKRSYFTGESRTGEAAREVDEEDRQERPAAFKRPER